MGLRIFSRSSPACPTIASACLALLSASCAEGEHFPTWWDMQTGRSSGDPLVELADTHCDGACPLLVDPAASAEGDGSSWGSPRRDLQAAIDAQAALGGGEVWVRGGGPFEALAGDPSATLIQLRARVGVFGGFEGTEVTREERDPAARTLIQGAPATDDDDAEPLITGASEATLDGFSITEQHGVSLLIRDATDFRVANLTIDKSAVYRGGQVDVKDSSGWFEALRIQDSTSVHGVPGLLAASSDVAIRDAEFARLKTLDGAACGVAGQSARLVLERVRFTENDSDVLGKASGLAATDSDVLVVDSVWQNNRGDRSTLTVSNSRFLAVSSHWENNRAIAPAASLLKGSSGWFLNSSFVGNSASAYGTMFARDSALEIVSASFADNDMDFPTPGAYAEDVGVAGTGTAALYNSYSNRGASSILEPYTGAGNCLVDDREPSRSTSAGVTRVLLRSELGCADLGDDAAARAATERAGAFAATMGVTIPLTGAWWQGSSSVVGVDSDAGVIDPGRHYGE